MKFVINGQLLEAKSLAYFAAKPYVLLRPIFEALGGIISWQAREHQAVVTWQSNHIVVPATGRNIIINGQMHAVKEAHHLVDGRLWVSLADLAELLRGTLRQEAEQLSLFLPSSFLTGISVSKEALTFHGVGSSRLLLSAEDTPGVYTLVDAAWNMPLRSITIRQSPQGFLQLQLEAGGSPLGAHFTETELRFTWPRPEQELAGLVIVVALDAGHGGQQPGAVGTTGVLEKNLTRLVVDLLAMRLRAAGALVVDVRPGDETVSLAQRVKRSQVAQAQIFFKRAL